MSNDKIKGVVKKHADKLMAVPGVIGVAEVESEGRPCIIVFVLDKNSESLKHLPQNIEGYLLKIEESGEFQARSTCCYLCRPLN